jgi:hypothetical protein
VSCCPQSLSVSLWYHGSTANSETENILLNILVIAGCNVEPNGYHIVHKACLEICMQLKRNSEYENK